MAGCTKKKWFSTKALAKQFLRRHKGNAKHAYLCDLCGRWHVRRRAPDELGRFN
jgi:hypothetical protein